MFSSSKAFSGLRAAPKKTVKPASFQVIKPSDRAGQALVKVSYSTQQGKDQRFTSQLATPWGKWGQMGALFAVAYGSYLLTEEDDKKKRNASFLDQFLPSAEAQTAVEPPSEKLAQPTVVTGNLNNGGFLIVHLNDGVDLRKVALAAAKLPDIAAEVAGGDTLYAGIAFGTQTWEQIAKQNKLGSPQNLKHFKTKVGKHGSMPATGGDILVHVKAKTQSQCWEVFQEFLKTLPPGSVASIDDEYGWHYQEGRDLSGFIDGTENVADLKEKRAAALLQTGGSYVIHQRWHHDLKGFHAKPEGEQEAIIGRSKPDSARLEKLSPTSHVARSRTDSDTQIPIVRQSMPFGSLKGPHGLLFIAYANDPSRFDTLLDRMTGNSGGPHNDAIMTFSKCIKSQYYYVPSIKELKSFA